MKVLFLDHDGVICLSSEWGGRFNVNREGLDSVFDDFNTKAIDVLNEIIEATDFNTKAIDVLNEIIEATNWEIVISSNWRHHATLEQLKELYTICGIKKTPISVTSEVDYTTEQRLELEKDRCI